MADLHTTCDVCGAPATSHARAMARYDSFGYTWIARDRDGPIAAGCDAHPAVSVRYMHGGVTRDLAAEDGLGEAPSLAQLAAQLPIDLRGEWSPVQAAAVLEIVRPQADALGLTIRVLDVTHHNSPGRRLIFTARLREAS